MIYDRMDPKLQLLTRKSFECWRIYASTKSKRRRAVRKAVYSYNVRLKQKALNTLRRNCSEAKMAQSFSDGYALFRAVCDLQRKTVLKRALRSWSVYSVNRRRIRTLNEKASEIEVQLIVGKYIRNWKSMSLEKKENRELEEKAIATYRDFLLRKSLRLWIEDHNRTLDERKKWESAIVHYDTTLLTKVWHAWVKYCNIKIEKSNKIAETHKFYKTKLLKMCFSALFLNASWATARRALHEAAMNFYSSRLLQRIMLVWINHHRRTINMERKIEMHCRKREIELKQKTLQQWRLYVWKKKCGRRKNASASNHYRRKLSVRSLAVMKKYVLYRKQKIASLHYLTDETARISLTMQKLYIDKWRTALIRLAEERQKLFRAEEYWSMRSLKNYFSIWKIFSESYKSRARLKSKLNEIGKCVLLNAYLTRWRAKYSAFEKINKMERQAVAAYSRKMKLRLFKSWKIYTEAKRKRKIETEELTKFYRELVLRNSSNEIYKSFSGPLRSAKKTCVDDLRILQKFFDAWLAFLRNKKDKTIMDPHARIANRGVYPIPHSRGLVLPEYMRKKKTIDSRVNCGFYEENWQNDNVEFSKFARRYLTFLGSKSPSDDSSTSGSETSNDSSHATYSVQSPIYARTVRNILC